MNDDTIENEAMMNASGRGTTRRRRATKTIACLGVAGLCATFASVVPIGGISQAQTPNESDGLVCTNGDTSSGHRVFDLSATDGYTTEPDGNAIYGWGFTATGSFQLPGPVLCANAGDIVDINLTNTLPIATSIQFPGQENVTAGGLPVGPVADAAGDLLSLVPEAPAGGTVSYSFTATSAGTYLYESGSDPQLQVQMGLFGAIVIRPVDVTITGADILAIPNDGGTDNGGAGMTQSQADAAALDAACAYASTTVPGTCDPLAIYDGSRENILMLSEVDPGLHSFMEQHKATPEVLTWNGYPGAYEAHYFLINGRSMPDTVAPNFAPWMPSQPYGAMAHVQPWDPHVNALDSLLRYVGVGIAGYDFHPHSNHEHVIAEDGALMKGTTGNDNTEEKFNIMVAPGATVDATFRWTNELGYSDTNGHRVPVTWPQGLNMMEGDFWSGSPYLGQSGVLNPGILTKTQCGEYYHVAHSHDLTQATNYGITFGGMLTLIKVEPPVNVQGTRQGDITVPVCNG
jgi:hypothetical protein